MKCQWVFVNAMRILVPSAVFTTVLKEIRGVSATPQRARDELTRVLVGDNASSKQMTCVILIQA